MTRILLASFFAGALFTWMPSIRAEEGFVELFDGKTLEGWDGDSAFWKIEDGLITGQTTKDRPTKGNTFCVWQGGEVGDFELVFEYRIDGGNSGFQYRSFQKPGNATGDGGDKLPRPLHRL